MKPRPRLPRSPMSIDPHSPSSSSPSSLASTLEYQRKQVYLEAAVAAQQQQQLLPHFSPQQNKQRAVQKSIISHQRNSDKGINNHYIDNSNNISNNNNSININNNNNILTKHQQLQQLLKNNTDNININRNHNLNTSPYALACKNLHWPQGSATNSQAPPSMPTSLLNLAACSSSNQTPPPSIGSSSSARSRIINNKVNSTASGNMPATRSSSLIRNSSSAQRSRNQSSLLQDDVSRLSKSLNASNLSIVNQKSNTKPAHITPTQIGQKKIPKSNIKSDLNQSHSMGSQSITIELVSSSHPPDFQQHTNTKIDQQDKDLDYMASVKSDDSVLQPPVSLGNKSHKHVNAYATGMLNDSDQLTNEIKSLILEECNIIYECKSCSNLFRSLPNFVKHKRTFCPERSSPEDGLKCRSMASLLSVDSSQNFKSDDKASTSHESEDQDISLEPNSAVVDFRPLDYENGNIVTHTYNSRGPGKSYNLAHELRMLRLLHNHDRKAQQQKEAARQKERSLIANDPIPTETSLSKLLQSQPKSRLPASQDKALIEALTLATSPTVSSADANIDAKDLAKAGSSRKASSILSTRSLLSVEQEDLSSRRTNVDTNELVSSQTIKPPQGITRKIAPKRKFLEDCIQKVKRDKQIDEQGDQPVKVQLTSIGSNSNAVLQTPSLSDQLDQVQQQPIVARNITDVPSNINSGNNSQVDSDSDDILTIDLGETGAVKKKAQPVRGRRRSTNTSSNRVSSSSALLKALTRPVLEQNKTIKDTPIVTTINDTVKQVVSNPTPEDKNDNVDALPIDIKMTCDICNIDFIDSQSLVQHNEIEHLIEKLVYPCIFCSMSFTLLKNACKHIIEIHKKPRNELHRLKDVVKFRSHLTTDFSTCEDYVPSRESADISGEGLDCQISKTIKSDKSIEEPVTETLKDPATEPDRTNAYDTIEFSANEVDQAAMETNETTTKETDTNISDDECVNKEVDIVDWKDKAAVAHEDSKMKDREVTADGMDPKPEADEEAVPNLEGPSVKNLPDQGTETKDQIPLDMDISTLCDKSDSKMETKMSSTPDDIKDLDYDNRTDSELDDDRSTKHDYQRESAELSSDGLSSCDFNLTSGDEPKPSHYHKLHSDQSTNKTNDKKDIKVSHDPPESSSRKHHSKDDVRHKNRSRSRSSSTEHVKTDERPHHKTSSNHHTSSAKRKHQPKGEPKTSPPVPSAEPIMKLKIQLKTRPDEKCKVYEIV